MLFFFFHINCTLGCKCGADFGEEFGGVSVWVALFSRMSSVNFLNSL